MEDTSTVHDADSATLHYLVEPDGLEFMDGNTVFFQTGQAVQLEDGTTAFLQTSEDGDGTLAGALAGGFHPVELEDGTVAYFAVSGSSLDPITIDQNLAMVEAADGNILQVAEFQTGEDGDSEAVDDEISYPLGLVEVEDKQTQFSLDAENILEDLKNSTRVTKTKSGAKSYECPLPGCSKTYSALHHLKVHARSHTGDRPFSCTEPTCKKRFGTNYALKAHIRTHTGEKPYHCLEETCGKSFKTSGDLQKHIRTHTGERPFKCSVPGCNRAFTTSNIRKVHVRTHTGERPYECTEPGCGRAFASATNFKNHMRIHSGEKPYVCTVKMCGRRFTEYSSLYKHQTVHTEQKPYECRECGRHYRQSSTLTMHRRTAHGIIQALDGSEIVLSLPPNSGKIENFMFLELTKDGSTLVPLNTSRCSDSSSPSPATVTAVDEDDSDDYVEGTGSEVSVVSREMVDEDGNSMGQILVVTDDHDVTSLENFDSLDNVEILGE